MPPPQKAGRLLPLHLAIMERFMMLDDRPGFPMTFVIELTLAGQIDKSAWEEALVRALEHQPLLTSVLGQAKGGKTCWVATEHPYPRCNWATEGVPIERPTPKESFDLTKEPGLRVWIRQGPERAVVSLQFHHACSDGIGAYRFIGELLAAYGILVEGPEKHAMSELDPLLLRGRQRRALGCETPTAWSRARKAIAYALRLYWGSPVTLATPKAGSPNTPDPAFPGYATRSLDRDTHQRLRNVAAAGGAVVNDLLIRDLFLTIERWQKLHGPGSPRARLGIMMATDLRGSEDLSMPATNMVGYSFLRFAASECEQSAPLLDKVVKATNRIKHERAGSTFLETMLGATSVPGLLSFMTPTWWSLATIIFSNVSDPSRRFTSKLPRSGGKVRAGNLLLEDITGIPPYRPGSRATLSIFQYDRRLTVCLRCDPKVFRYRDAEELLDLYVDQLRASAAPPESASAKPPLDHSDKEGR